MTLKPPRPVDSWMQWLDSYLADHLTAHGLALKAHADFAALKQCDRNTK